MIWGGWGRGGGGHEMIVTTNARIPFSLSNLHNIACEMAPMYSGMNKNISEQSKLSVAWGSKKWWGSL